MSRCWTVYNNYKTNVCFAGRLILYILAYERNDPLSQVYELRSSFLNDYGKDIPILAYRFCLVSIEARP